MTSERWRKIEELYHLAEARDPKERSGFLAEVCQGDDQLQRQIEALLVQGAVGHILDGPAGELLTETARQRTARSLSAGDRLGPYEIADLIGAGGMGEVYRARDSRLHREVALKILPAELSRDPERRQRFEREGRAVAALNHPNIVSIHDVGEEEGVYFIVTELVDGEPVGVADMSLRETLEIGVQTVSGLAAAHQEGIVHRDLKPANILLNRKGQVKILDFGLAKLDAAVRNGLAKSETLKTQTGMVMGTVSYMSPEQLRGESTDHRSDIFSFGVILYELLAGRRAFQGSTAQVISAILSTDLPELPETVPSGVRQIVAHCLERDPAKRFQSAADLGFALAALAQGSGRASTSPGAAPTPAGYDRRQWVWMAAAAITSLIAGCFAFAYVTRKVPDGAVVRFSFAPPFAADAIDVAVSPDGRRIAFADSNIAEHVPALWLQSIDSLSAQRLPGTEGAIRPFWSPDGHSLGFISPNGVKDVDLSGGQAAVQSVIPYGGYFFGGGARNQGGVILFQPEQTGSGLYQVPISGGKPSPATRFNMVRKDIAHRYPQFLPDGRHFLYWVWSALEENTGVYIGSLDQQEKLMEGPLVRTWREAHYAEPGYILFLQGSTLMARRFDPGHLRFIGDRRPVPEHIGLQWNWTGQAMFSTSANGAMVYQEATPQLPGRIVLRGRDGKLLRTVEGPSGSGTPSLDPSEKNVVVLGANENAVDDLWRIDLERGVPSRLTATVGANRDPIWSPDGQRIAFRSNRSGVYDLYAKSADGSGDEELLVSSPHTKFPSSWSMDGRFLVYDEVDPVTKFRRNISVLSLHGDHKTIRFLKSEFNEFGGKLSPVPDSLGHLWMAYTSNETGSPEIYLRAFLPDASAGPAGAKVRVSAGGGRMPLWRRDGCELFYFAGDKLMALDIKLGAGTPEIGVPHKLFEETNSDWDWAVFRGGQRFLFIEPAVESPLPKINVVLNWVTELK